MACCTGLLHKLRSWGISGQIFGLIFSVVDGFESFWIEILHRSICLLLEFQGSILGPALFLLYINDLPDGVICAIGIYADDTTLYSGCDQASDLWR